MHAFAARNVAKTVDMLVIAAKYAAFQRMTAADAYAVLIAKGHHVSAVTNVVMCHADAAWFMMLSVVAQLAVVATMFLVFARNVSIAKTDMKYAHVHVA